MSGVVAGQVFSEDELERLLVWFEIVDHRVEIGMPDSDLAAKVRGYLEPIACRVPE